MQNLLPAPAISSLCREQYQFVTKQILPDMVVCIWLSREKPQAWSWLFDVDTRARCEQSLLKARNVMGF